eukprot:130996-Rhodomonas_salina.7
MAVKMEAVPAKMEADLRWRPVMIVSSGRGMLSSRTRCASHQLHGDCRRLLRMLFDFAALRDLCDGHRRVRGV